MLIVTALTAVEEEEASPLADRRASTSPHSPDSLPVETGEIPGHELIFPPLSPREVMKDSRQQAGIVTG